MAGRSAARTRRPCSRPGRPPISGGGSGPARGPQGSGRGGTRCGWSAASTRIWLRPRRRVRRRAPPRSFHLRPGLLHPAGHHVLVPLDRPPGGDLEATAVPLEQGGHPLHGVAPEKAAPDQRLDPRQGPRPGRPPMRHRPLGRLTLQHGESSSLTSGSDAGPSFHAAIRNFSYSAWTSRGGR